MATRKEVSGNRSLAFSKWVRENLPDSSTGFYVTNQDWLFWNPKRRKLLLAEEKTKQGCVSPWFCSFIREVMDPALRAYCGTVGIQYYGYHIIRFQNSSPQDGWTWLDGRYVSEAYLQRYLSMEDDPELFEQPDEPRELDYDDPFALD